MLDSNGTVIKPGDVVFETGAFLSPGIVLADGVSVLFTPCADSPEYLIWPLADGEYATDDEPVAFPSESLVVVDPSSVEWSSYYPL